MTAGSRITICIALAGDRLGGSHISLKGLLDRLPESAYRVIVVPEVPGGRIAKCFGEFEQFEDPGALEQPFEVGRNFGLQSMVRTLPGAIGRSRLLRKLQVDIVHTNDGRSHASWALAARLAGAQMVWHHRGDPDAKGTKLFAPLLADQIVSVSEYALPKRRWGKLGDAKIIHSPFDVSVSVDRTKMRAKLIDELGCPGDTIICGYVGQFIARKRPLEFIDAVEKLAAISNRPVVGVMFGEAEDPAVYAKMQQRFESTEDKPPVKLMGYREPGHEWIAACDALLVPAVNEPLGRTLVEAMLVGTPVIASDSGGNPEALRPNCGVIVPAGNPGTMATETLTLLNDPTRCAQLTRAASEMAKTRFAAQNHVEQVSAIYSDLARKGRRSGLIMDTST